MVNFYSTIIDNPGMTRQILKCGDSLITTLNCPLQNKFQDIWSQANYIVYVAKGRKIWHTIDGSFELTEGSCMFVQKGAGIVEQFRESEVSFFLFFITDEFIVDVLKNRSTPMRKVDEESKPLMRIHDDQAVHAFFHSMLTIFGASREPDRSLLELKFRELILTMAENPLNKELLCYFNRLLQEPQAVSLQRIMEANFCYNLGLEEFAKLSARSLSAFKRDFQKIYNTSPGKWLIEKRLEHAKNLIVNLGKTVSEAAFESGFENGTHFSRAFRQRFGYSPMSARQANAVVESAGKWN
jgi:AraC family transcriptional regulator, exoenzyme S synthesis regulatory protein ExsA